MKALTLTQPWATLVAIGAKRIETRSWHAEYRGPLAIHAAKGWTRTNVDLFFTEPFKTVLNDAGYKLFSLLPRGAIVATCTLEMCDRISTGCQGWNMLGGDGTRWPLDDQERFFGDFTPGRHAWLLANVERLPEPVPARGALGLWEWKPEEAL